MGFLIELGRFLWRQIVHWSSFLWSALRVVVSLTATLWSLVFSFEDVLPQMFLSISTFNSFLTSSIIGVYDWLNSADPLGSRLEYFRIFVNLLALDHCVSSLATFIDLTITFIGLFFAFAVPMFVLSLLLAAFNGFLKLSRLLKP